MSNQLKPGTIRVSYVENKTVDSALSILATAKRTNKSALVREATEAYLAKHDPKKEITRLAASLIESLPDESEDRVTTDLDPELQTKVVRLIQAIRSK